MGTRSGGDLHVQWYSEGVARVLGSKGHNAIMAPPAPIAQEHPLHLAKSEYRWGGGGGGGGGGMVKGVPLLLTKYEYGQRGTPPPLHATAGPTLHIHVCTSTE